MRSASQPSLLQLRELRDPGSPTCVANSSCTLDTLSAIGPLSPGSASPSLPSRSASVSGLAVPSGAARLRTRAPIAQAISSRQLYQTPFVEAYEHVAKQRNLRKLAELFAEADEDGSQSMSLGEFRNALSKPRIQRTFSTLGVQPHQSELVFKSMAKSEHDELSFGQFWTGLQGVVGTDVDGTGTELDLHSLKPTRAAKLQRESMRVLAESAGSTYRSQTPSLSEARHHRAFIDAAQARALLPPPVASRAVHRVTSKARR